MALSGPSPAGWDGSVRFVDAESGVVTGQVRGSVWSGEVRATLGF